MHHEEPYWDKGEFEPNLAIEFSHCAVKAGDSVYVDLCERVWNHMHMFLFYFLDD